MFLKKKKMSKLEGEQLYMFEILVGRLNLCPEKTVNNKECNLMIRIGFIDLMPVDIVAEESTEVKGKRSKNKENRFLDEYTKYEGKTCLLVRTSSNLIRSVKSTPLSVEVYRIPRGDDCNSQNNLGQILLCAAIAFLPGCFCDRVAAAKDKIDGLSKPYILTDVYTLTDEKGSPCGSVSMYMRLSCFGSSIINHLVLHEKSFVFRGFPFSSQFCCEKLSDKNINNEKNRIKHDDNTFSLLSKILDPVSPKLHNQKDCIDMDSLLTRPGSPPRVSMDQPGFEKLTNAEKLNDRKYRNLIYQRYPDEPTCACLPIDRSMHPMTCRSGCARSCCMALKNPNILKNNSYQISSLAVLTHCVNNLHLESGTTQDVNCCNATRMIDGEGREDNCLNNEMLWDEEYAWHENNINLKDRMKGGSDYGASAHASSEPTTTFIYQKSKETDASSQCRSCPRTDRIKAANCICPGKDMSSWKTGTSKCTKQPCIGADCMIRAFKEVQEFVDSLGRVPGLVGLGLMDPSESPYFGRDIDKDYTVQETPSERKRGAPVLAPPALFNLQCTAPCNTQIDKSVVSNVLTPFASSIPMTIAVSGRTGVVRETIPTLPEEMLIPAAVKLKRKEEKREEKLEKQKEVDITTSVLPDVDVGPCGEPTCKSRRKILGNSHSTVHEIVGESQKTSVGPSKPLSTFARGVNKFSEKKRHLRGRLGPGGDRNTGKIPIKISKRVMRYVYSIGDIYPGISYGHKNCIDPRFRVPANMGWLWNTGITLGKLKPRIGWKPGAIGRYLNELLKEAKGATLMEDNRPRQLPSRTGLRRGKVYKAMSHVSQVKEGEEEAEPPPTLHIHRKDGTYYVTMYPIRQETTDVPQLDEPMKPLQFKIVRNKDDASVASSSTASDMEIEFSPPAAVNRYRRKPDVIHVDTQVRQQEILDAYKSTVEAKKKERKGKRGKK